jgi:ABC-2 type transport system permease protein
MLKALDGFVAVFYKEVLHLRRDSMAVLMALIMPLFQMAMLGWAIDTNVRNVPTTVLNEDGRRESREFLDRLRNSDTFHFVRTVGSDKELQESIVSGEARVAVKIPPDYSDRLLRKEGAQVLVLIDGSDSSVSGQALNVSTTIGLDESLKRMVETQGPLPVEVRPRVLFNPDSKSPNFLLPGMIAMLLLQITCFLTAFSVVREKESGTLEQLFVTPVKPLGMLLGKISPYMVLAIAELVMMLLAMRYVFSVPIEGSLVSLFLLSIPYLFVALSFGTFVSTKATSQSEAMQMSFMIFIPTIFLSGYIFPRETMPLFFRCLSYLVPASYYVDTLRGIILRGAGLRHMWMNGVALLAMGTILLVAAARRFHNKVVAV